MLRTAESLSHVLVAVVMLIGAAVCLSRFHLQPRRYLLILIAIGLELFTQYGMTTAIVWIARSIPDSIRFRERDASTPDWAWVLMVLPGYLAHAATWGILFYVGLKLPRERRARYLVESVTAHSNSIPLNPAAD